MPDSYFPRQHSLTCGDHFIDQLPNDKESQQLTVTYECSSIDQLGCAPRCERSLAFTLAPVDINCHDHTVIVVICINSFLLQANEYLI